MKTRKKSRDHHARGPHSSHALESAGLLALAIVLVFLPMAAEQEPAVLGLLRPAPTDEPGPALTPVQSRDVSESASRDAAPGQVLERARLLPFSLQTAPSFPGGSEALERQQLGHPAEALRTLDAAPSPSGTDAARRLALRAQLLLELERYDDAARALEGLETRLPDLADHLLALRGKALLAGDHPLEAIAALQRIPPTSPLSAEAMQLTVSAQLEHGDPAQALETLRLLVGTTAWERLDSTTLRLLGEAHEAGGSSGPAIQALRLLALQAPLSDDAQMAAPTLQRLAASGAAPAPWTGEEQLQLARAYAEANLNREVIAHLEALGPRPPSDPISCDAAYLIGVAYQNEREYTHATPSLEQAAALCPPELAVRALYRLARGELARGNPGAADLQVRSLLQRFPDSSYADDALFILASGWQGEGDLTRATALLEEQLQTYPQGDMRSEAAWRLAWVDFRRGDLAAARARVEVSLVGSRFVSEAGEAKRTTSAPGSPRPARAPAPASEVREVADGRAAGTAPDAPTPPGTADVAPPERGAHAARASGTIDTSPSGPIPPEWRADARLTREAYWSARWLDLAGGVEKEEVVLAYQRLARLAPTDYYGLMAFQHLRRLAPGRAREVASTAARLRQDASGEERVPLDLEALPLPVKRAVLLLQCGLKAQARRELEPLISQSGGDEPLRIAWLLEQSGDYFASHRLLDRMLKQDGELAPREARFAHWILAYPPAYEALMLEVAGDLSIDPFLMTALAREESAFDPAIRSWAGATGLVQLMDATARGLANQLKIEPPSAAALTDPRLNLTLGSTYMQRLLRLFDGQVGLAIPSYNAGEGAVMKWVKTRQDRHFDAFVEEIPYKQTRDYVRRVLATYQTYHYLYRGETPFLTVGLKLPRK